MPVARTLACAGMSDRAQAVFAFILVLAVAAVVMLAKYRWHLI